MKTSLTLTSYSRRIASPITYSGVEAINFDKYVGIIANINIGIRIDIFYFHSL